MRALGPAAAVALCVSLVPAVVSHATEAAGTGGYHSYAEMTDHIHAVAAAHPGIVRVFSIGQSHQGREIWAAEVSDNVGTDEGEPEVLFDGLHHARERLSGEQAIAVLDLLASRYGSTGTLGRRVTRLVDSRRIWIVFMVNPDGVVHDSTGGPHRGQYRAWRKNRQPTPGAKAVGTDLNRNYGYRFGCCGGSSGKPGSDFFRGPRAFSAPETRALRDFVRGRVVKGRQRIRAHISFHTAGELVLWPYGHTLADVPRDMTALDARTFRALGRQMATRSGYRPKQSSDMYVTDGDLIDWMYGRQRVFSFTFELYPRGGGVAGRYYPPPRVIDRETRRNRSAILYLIGRAACPYEALGKEARKAWCGPFFDDFEVFRGWRVDPDGTDTATAGRWQRGVPAKAGPQLGTATSGMAVLVTGRRAWDDVDGGRTTVRSPRFRVPANGSPTLRLRYWVALGPGATREDGLRVHLVDEEGARVVTLFRARGTGERRTAKWRTLRRAIPAHLAGQRIAIELEAVDAGSDSLVEAAVDDVRVTVD
jgi:carboxypeptidase T